MPRSLIKKNGLGRTLKPILSKSCETQALNGSSSKLSQSRTISIIRSKGGSGEYTAVKWFCQNFLDTQTAVVVCINYDGKYHNDEYFQHISVEEAKTYSKEKTPVVYGWYAAVALDGIYDVVIFTVGLGSAGIITKKVECFIDLVEYPEVFIKVNENVPESINAAKSIPLKKFNVSLQYIYMIDNKMVIRNSPP